MTTQQQKKRKRQEPKEKDTNPDVEPITTIEVADLVSLKGRNNKLISVITYRRFNNQPFKCKLICKYPIYDTK
jgi:hypothetical protein